MSSNDCQIFSLTLDVQPAGGQPFAAIAITPILAAAIAQFQVGTQLVIKYDPVDPTRACVDHRVVEPGQS